MPNNGPGYVHEAQERKKTNIFAIDLGVKRQLCLFLNFDTLPKEYLDIAFPPKNPDEDLFGAKALKAKIKARNEKAKAAESENSICMRLDI